MSNTKELLPELEIELDEPIEWNGKSVSSVVLREPKAREVQQALAEIGNGNTPDTVYKYQISLISKVSGHSRQIIEQLPIRKLAQGFRYLEAFLEPGPETGES
ncbi:phage tail assembly protein [Paracraurococcus lichenis]|uniref:Phage tail assembly protein n=1 Tax=Paracraurococcus lichenis TaxID=3064888 RepID=A0ABT9EDK0_9PROT|nr:phage tail assembly protein [Paracraurococcus sp. LOR1-02]MDO9714298.1 phage tail assembly protein [Paracraurococcus sp. LOR1-02]